jgi:hypothetical protein
VLASSGVERLLNSLHPLARWRPPVLEVRTCPNQPRDGYLQGRGLVLIPSVFCGRPVALHSLADQAAPTC